MRKELMFIATTILLIITLSLFTSEPWVYLTALLMASIIMLAIRHFSARILKITRWSKANPRKTQLLITVVQLVILLLGIIVGYDLKELGYTINYSTAFVFATILLTGFLSVHFIPKHNSIVIPSQVNKDRMAYVSIILSAFVMMVITGNRIEDKFPDSPITYALRSIDRAIFIQTNIPEDDPDILAPGPGNEHKTSLLRNEASVMLAVSTVIVKDEESILPATHSKKEVRAKLKAEKKAERVEKKQKRAMKRIEKLRKAFAAGATVGTVLLVILLIGTLCGGICLIIAGFSGSGALIPLGAVVTAGSIWGIIKLTKKKKETL